MNQHALNTEIEAFIQQKDKAKSAYSTADKTYVSKYGGAGGQGSKGASGEGLLYEFFTPDYICELMWNLAYRYGYEPTGTVLEPSLGTGNFLKWASDLSKCYGFEINPVSKRICEILYPESRIYEGYFDAQANLLPRQYLFLPKHLN